MREAARSEALHLLWWCHEGYLQHLPGVLELLGVGLVAGQVQLASVVVSYSFAACWDGFGACLLQNEMGRASW